jgi:pilus assembly protein FimV
MMKPPRPAEQAAAMPHVQEAFPGWRARSIAAVAVAASLALPLHDAQALTLGRLTVQSALGQPLRAEIDIPEISSDESATLQTAIAAPEAFPPSAGPMAAWCWC